MQPSLVLAVVSDGGGGGTINEAEERGGWVTKHFMMLAKAAWLAREGAVPLVLTGIPRPPVPLTRLAINRITSGECDGVTGTALRLAAGFLTRRVGAAHGTRGSLPCAGED